MAQRKVNNVKLTKVQKVVGSLLLKCNKTESDEVKGVYDDTKRQMPEMVGFQSEASLPVSPLFQPSQETHINIRKLVCSPDIPINEYPSKSIESIQCQICHKMYTSKSAFQAHQRTHAKETEDPYRCNICSKTFAVPARLTRHYRTHTGEKPFRCEFCNKSFSVKENLSVHRRIHTKERPYKCEVCSRAFEHSGKLHRHMRIHTGERPHKCNVCAKTFIQSGQLVIHMRTHTGEKPYICNVCQKGFTCSKQLKVHSRTHTGEKPYSCEICGKSFGYNHVLKLHQVAHYGEKVYKCTICNDTFNSKKSMEAHIKSHSDSVVTQHPVQPPTPPASGSSSESSCSSNSDKENFKELLPSILEQNLTRESPIGYFYSSRDRISPVYIPGGYSLGGVDLLAAAATATDSIPERYRCPEVVFGLSNALRAPYFPASTIGLNDGDLLRRQVEEALADVHDNDGFSEGNSPHRREPQNLTPPRSNPASPAQITPPVSPSTSPDPELSLPPRKRSKMIQKSMEDTSIDLSLQTSPVQRYSVIQYAGAS